MLTVTKQFRFEAAHFLPNHPGLCKNFHGHSYLLEVTIRRIESPGYDMNTLMVMDFGTVKEIVNDSVIKHFDHKNLNEIFDIPTAEAMVQWIANKLIGRFASHGVCVHEIKLWETVSSYACWKEN